MAHYQEEITLCGASAYTQKYYLNEDFGGLPDGIKKELQIMCVLFTEDIGGTLRLVFDGDGALSLLTDSAEDDFLYDEIGAVLKVKALQREKRELFEALELYYRVFLLGEDTAFSEAEDRDAAGD